MSKGKRVLGIYCQGRYARYLHNVRIAARQRHGDFAHCLCR